PEPPAVVAGRAGGARRRVRPEVRVASAAAAALGRLPAGAGLLGVLAGQAVAAARPDRVSTRGGCALVSPAALTLTAGGCALVARTAARQCSRDARSSSSATGSNA